MKKPILYILACYMMFILIGCAAKEEPVVKPEEIVEVPSVETDDIEKEAVVAEENMEVNPEPIEETEPEELSEAEKIYERYKTVFEENGFNFTLSDGIEISRVAGVSHKFEIIEISEIASGRVVFFDHYKTGVLRKNFYIDFSLDNSDRKAVKECITATLFVLDDGMTKQKAEKISKEMVNSLADNPKSKVVSCGEYKIYLKEYALMGSEKFKIKVIHNSEINVPVDKEQYKRYGYKEMRISLNDGEKIHLTAKVSPYGEEKLFAKDKKENVYLVYYNPDKFIHKFKVNQQYELYGVISEVAVADEALDLLSCMELEYYELE